MAMAISAEQPVMPSSLAAKLWEQGGTWQVLQCCMCCYYNIVHCVCHYIYIYCSTLVRKCSECQELPLKDLSGLAFAMRFAMGCDQMAFVEFDCMTFGDLREFDTFFAADFRILHWNFKFWKYTRISCRSLVCRNIWKPWAMGFVWMSRSFSKMRSFDHFWYRFACSFHAFIDF